MRIHSVLPLLIGLVVAVGCKKQPPVAEPVMSPPPLVEMQPQPEATPPVDEPGPIDLDSVYFDFDRSEIRGDQVGAMRGNLADLKRNPRVTIRVEGNCDERGSTDYNLALGERRARAAKAWLVDQGVAASRITTLSYGEERPVDLGHHEAAWAKNRRAEFHVTGGQAPLALR